MNAEEHRITTSDQLRSIIPAANSATMAKVLDHLDEQGYAFLAASPFILLSTATRDGRIEVSPKGDEQGFVKIEDSHTIVIPDRSGNNLAFGLTNILENPHVGLIALRPGTGESLRISGDAELSSDPVLLEKLSARGRPALLAVRIRITHAYFHCARSILRAGLWKPETWPEPQRVSFGRIFRERMGVNEQAAQTIDRNVNEAYETGL